MGPAGEETRVPKKEEMADICRARDVKGLIKKKNKKKRRSEANRNGPWKPGKP